MEAETARLRAGSLSATNCWPGSGVLPCLPKTQISGNAKRGLFTVADFIYDAGKDRMINERKLGAVSGMRLFELITRTVFAVASIALMLLAAALIVYAGVQVSIAYRQPDSAVGSALLEAVGYTVIAIAVFDVGKYLLEEESIRAREMRQAGEARRSMTKFVTTIAVAIFLESLVTVFEASKTDISTMIYPTFLLLGGVALLVGLGIYQRLSLMVENDAVSTDGKDEKAARVRNGKRLMTKRKS